MDAQNDPTFAFNPLVKQDPDSGQILTTSGDGHLDHTMAISAGQLLTPPFHGVYTTVPLGAMLNWHNGKPDPEDTNREWVVEDLPGCKGRGYIKQVCREYRLRNYRSPSSRYEG